MIHILRSLHSPHQSAHAEAMKEGLAQHNLDCRVVGRAPMDTSSTVICWGWRVGRAYHEAGCKVLVMERGYIGDRFAWTSLAWNGLNNRGTMPAAPDDGGKRFETHNGGALGPWNALGKYILLCGQVPGDMSLQGRNLQGWYVEQAEKWNARGKQVVFRPHPLAHKRAEVLPVLGTKMVQGDLGEALAGAELVVTYNSNCAVDALLAGKLVHVEDEGSMAWGWTDRTAWAHRLAWRQFSMDEIRSGFAWSVANGR
jgi:hypothetical protein